MSQIQEIKSSVLDRLNAYDTVSRSDLLTIIDEELYRFRSSKYLSTDEINSLRMGIFNSIYGLDVLQELVDDDSISEIMVNGYNDIFIERNGVIEKSPVHFESPQKLQDTVQHIVSLANRRINEACPITDSRLPDGSRVNIVLNPVSLDGPAITIRKFPKFSYTMDNLISFGTITDEAAAFLKKLVESGYNIFISGGTGSGKTTFLNILSNYIPKNERLVTIEDSAELQLNNAINIVRLEARQENTTGAGEIGIDALIKCALRMRPDRIIVGEVRGAEALSMLQVMNTGHDGSLSTGHSNSAKDMLSRLETMVLMGANMPINAIRSQIASAIDIVIHLARIRDHSRKVVQICEITGFDGENILMQTLYTLDEHKNLVATGNKLRNTTKAEFAGIEVAN